MELFHQIRFTRTQIPDWRTLLREEGISLVESAGSWLGGRYPTYFDLVCEKSGQKAVFAVAEGMEASSKTSFVYVNLLGKMLPDEIRKLFELRGAEWSYFKE